MSPGNDEVCLVKHVIGVADMKISADRDDSLITYALGSCLGITIYDPLAQVGGMLHVMLPTSGTETDKSISNPLKFMDTGLPRLFLDSYKMGARKERLVVKAAGGASSRHNGPDDLFQIGKRNFVMLRKLLWRNGLLLKSYDVGGNAPRTLSLDVSTGAVTLKIERSITFL